MSYTDRELLNFAGSLIAGALVMILAYLCWSLVNQSIPQSNENILFAVVGVVATQITQIVSFFFGSSQSAKKQSETIDRLSQTTQTAQNAALPTGSPTLAPGEQITVKAEKTEEGD